MSDFSSYDEVEVIVPSGRMKKFKSRKPSPAAKSRKSPRTLDEYVAAVHEPARDAVTRIREAIRSVVPKDATEVISYAIPAFKHKRVLVWYAAFSDHCSLFPTAAVIEKFKDELKGFSTSKGTIHFPLAKSMPIALIKRIVRERVTAERRQVGQANL